ncbi:MAG: PAS domain-containing sensor histidine kinase [Azoarcus sp.]|nr:MAG: PAS domain-containing sensor histidine kinase [Azoarcus sp.]
MAASAPPRLLPPPLPSCWLASGADTSEACWQLALECGGDGVWDWNIGDGKVFYGPRFNALLGYDNGGFGDDSEAFVNHVHPDDIGRLRQHLRAHFRDEGTPFCCDLRMRDPNYGYRWMQVRGQLIERNADGEPARILGTLRDISQWRQDEAVLKAQLAETVRLNQQLEGAQVQLVQSEKLAAIGQLAAGVAHELKTPIGFVSTNFGTLERNVGDMLGLIAAYHATAASDDPAQALAAAEAQYVAADIDYLREDLPALFAESRDGLDRVQRIARDLKDFSRVGEQDWQFADLHRGLDSTINILRYEIKHKAEVIREYGELPEVWCVPSMINQVFLNLLANAAQAIETQGTITVVTAVEGDKVLIRIADTGSGIPPDILNRIFVPFFTTKAAGKGTGLGLSLAQDIIRQHHGRLFATSVPGQGSTFTIELPLTELQPPDTLRPADTGINT